MSRSRPTRAQFLAQASLVLLLASGSSSTLAQRDARNDLSKEEIFQRSKEAYGALSSYSDEGKVVVFKDGAPDSTWTVAIRLSRPNLFRVEWHRNNPSPADPKSENKAIALWSSGQGDFVDTVKGEGETRDQVKASTPTGEFADGDVANIPHFFFKTSTNVLDCCSEGSYKQLPDEKVGAVDCFVFVRLAFARHLEKFPRTQTTVWIGKDDFLVRQVRTTATIRPKSDGSLTTKPVSTTSTETHTNIVLDAKLSNADFASSKLP